MQCRVCLGNAEESKSKSLFLSSIDGATIAEMLSNLFGLQFSVDDAFPQKMCERCYDELQTVLCFREKLLLSDETLRATDRSVYGEHPFEESIASCITGTDDLVERSECPTKDGLDDWGCSECGNSTYNREPANLFTQHLHRQPDKPLCRECYNRIGTEQQNVGKDFTEENFTSPSSTIETQRFCCVTHCSQMCRNEPELIQHAKETHAIKLQRNEANRTSERSFVCNICFRAFHTSKNLRIHQLIRTNLSHKSFACTECSFRTNSKGSLTIHERSHTGERPFGCDICGKRFSSKPNLTSHQICHQNERPFVCAYCTMKFARKRTMTEHIQACHSDEKPYTCEECSARFKTLQHLRLHRRLHTGEKPYECSICPKSFYHISDRKRHELSHAGMKPYVCTICDASYSRKHSLSIHERTHTGERPFECNDCGKRFARTALLKRHMARHRNEGASSNQLT